MKKLRKFLLSALSVSSILCFATGLAACGKQKVEEEKPSLSFDVEQNISIAYGEYCTVPSVVAKDEGGNLYFPKVKVTDSNNQEIVIEKGKFFVLSNEFYTFTYSLTFKGATVVKTTTAQVKDLTAPVIKLETEGLGGFINNRVEVPTVTYSDNITSVEKLTFAVKAFYGEQEIALDNNGFTPTESGEYTIKYTVADENNNVAEENLPVQILEYENGNVAYWNNPYWKELTDSSFMAEDQGQVIYGAGQYASPMGGKSLGFTINNGIFRDGCKLYLDNPAIKDISDYRYLYLWVYTTRSGGVRLFYNNYWYGPRSVINQGVWTRVVFERGEDGNFHTVGTDLTGTGMTTKIFAPVEETSSASKATPTDISEFSVGFQAVEEPQTGYTSVYFGGLYVANELPALPSGTMDWKPLPTVAVTTTRSYYLVGSTAKIEYMVANGADYTVRTYLQKETGNELLPSGQYTFTESGEYTFLVEVLQNGQVVTTSTRVLNAVERVDGDIAYFNNENGEELAGLNVNGQSTYLGSGLYLRRGTDEYASPMGGSSWHVSAAMYAYKEYGFDAYVDNPAIQDVSEYKYLYLWVYTTHEAGVRLSFNNQYYGSIVNVGSGQWTRIVFTRGADGNFYANGADREGATGKLFKDGENESCATNLSGFRINVMGLDKPQEGWINAYFGGFYACNELPTLPEGTVDWNGAFGGNGSGSGSGGGGGVQEEEKATEVEGDGIDWEEYFK